MSKHIPSIIRTLLLFSILPFLLAFDTPEATANAKRSRAVFSAQGEVAPNVNITSGQITIRHRATGSGKVKGTSLRGETSYTFSRDGTYNVKPGTYRHIVFGNVPAHGSIESVMTYR